MVSAFLMWVIDRYLAEFPCQSATPHADSTHGTRIEPGIPRLLLAPSNQLTIPLVNVTAMQYKGRLLKRGKLYRVCAKECCIVREY
jgi:hypothetical protein